MSDKYIIKVTRITPKSWDKVGVGIGAKENTHYYNGKPRDGRDNVYRLIDPLICANTFTEQETKKIILEVIEIYRTYPGINGELVKIEVLDAETKKVMSMYGSGCRVEPEIIISRFELMEL